LEVLLQPEQIRGGCGLDAARDRDGQHGRTVEIMNAEEIEIERLPQAVRLADGLAVSGRGIY
jgi:hypothetical protein